MPRQTAQAKSAKSPTKAKGNAASRQADRTDLEQQYSFKIYNGRVRLYVDGTLFFCFNQLDFMGLYAYKDDSDLYGLDIYLAETTMEIYFKTKAAWLKTLEILDTVV